MVIPRDSLDALSDGGLQRLLECITAELLQATLSIVEDEKDEIC